MHSGEPLDTGEILAGRPAARAVRIKPRESQGGAPDDKAGPEQLGGGRDGRLAPGSNGEATGTALPSSGIAPADTDMDGLAVAPMVVGEVVERNPSATPMAAPREPTSESSARVSRFLARKRQERKQASSMLSASGASDASQPSGLGAAHGIQTSEPFQQPSNSTDPADDPAFLARLKEDNARRLQGMSTKEIEDAQKEAMQLLGDSANYFLERRADQKTAAGAAGPKPIRAPQNAADLGSRSQYRATAPARAGPQRRPGAREGMQQQDVPLPIEARVRFDTAGRPIGLAPAVMMQPARDGREIPRQQGVAALQAGLDPETLGGLGGLDLTCPPQEVLQRDILRSQAGVADIPEGYTLAEATVLARSQYQQHRVAAMQLLAAVLARARPGLGGGDQGHGGSFGVPDEQGSGAVTRVAWAGLWAYALTDGRVLLTARLAMDDVSLNVSSLATKVMAAVVGARDDVEVTGLLLYASNPVAGGLVPQAHLERGKGQRWRSLPAEVCRAWRHQPGGPGWNIQRSGTVLPDEEQQGLQDEEIGALDPIAGFIRMAGVQRCVYLLHGAHASAAVESCVRCLLAAALAGQEGAELVAKTPGLIDALWMIVHPQAVKGLDVSDHMLRAAREARPLTAHLVCAIVANSRAGARTLRDAGVLRAVVSWAVSDRPADRSPAELAAALRVWRLCALQDVEVMPFDHAYAGMIPLLAPDVREIREQAQRPAESAADAASPSGVAPWSGAELTLSAELYQLLTSLVWQAAHYHGDGGGRSAEDFDAVKPGTMISPRCAWSVAGAAAEWLCEEALVIDRSETGEPELSFQLDVAWTSGSAMQLIAAFTAWRERLNGLATHPVGGQPEYPGLADAADRVAKTLLSDTRSVWAAVLSWLRRLSAALDGVLVAAQGDTLLPWIALDSATRRACGMAVHDEGSPAPMMLARAASAVIGAVQIFEVQGGTQTVQDAVGSLFEVACPLQRTLTTLYRRRKAAPASFTPRHAVFHQACLHVPCSLVVLCGVHGLGGASRELELARNLIDMPGLLPPGAEQTAQTVWILALRRWRHISAAAAELYKAEVGTSRQGSLAIALRGTREGDQASSVSALCSSTSPEALLAAIQTVLLQVPASTAVAERILSADANPATTSLAPRLSGTVAEGSVLPMAPETLLTVALPEDPNERSACEAARQMVALVQGQASEDLAGAGLRSHSLQVLLAVLGGVYQSTSTDGTGTWNPVWQHPAVRVALSANIDLLSERLQTTPMSVSEGDELAAALHRVESIVTVAATESAGDDLPLAHVAVLLHRAIPCPLRMRAFTSLAANQALRLVPPAERCPGGVAAYRPEWPSASAAASKDSEDSCALLLTGEATFEAAWLKALSNTLATADEGLLQSSSLAVQIAVWELSRAAALSAVSGSSDMKAIEHFCRPLRVSASNTLAVKYAEAVGSITSAAGSTQLAPALAGKLRTSYPGEPRVEEFLARVA